MINSHYVHVEDIPHIPRCHENLAGLPRRIFPSLPRPLPHAHAHMRKNMAGSRDYLCVQFLTELNGTYTGIHSCWKNLCVSYK